MNLALYLLLINVLTFAIYGLDKRAARRGHPRVPEMLLLFLGFVGGTVAAFVAQRYFRHKTKKLRFQVGFWVVTALQCGLLLMPPYALRLLFYRLFGVIL